MMKKQIEQSLKDITDSLAVLERQWSRDRSVLEQAVLDMLTNAQTNLERILHSMEEERAVDNPAGGDVNYAGDAERAEFQRFMEEDTGD